MKKTFVNLLLLSLVVCSSFVQLSSADEPKLSDYVGVYKMADFFQEAIVTEKEGFLYAELDSYGNNKLLKEPQEDTFKSTSSYGTIFIFKRDANKKVIGVMLKLMDQEVSGVKK
jgi:hypothetical protein